MGWWRINDMKTFLVVLLFSILFFVSTEIEAQTSLQPPAQILRGTIGSNEADMSALRISWPAVSGATKYWVQVSNGNTTNGDGTFTCTVGLNSGTGVQNCPLETQAVGNPTTNGWLTATTADIYNLTCNTTYYVHVKAANDTQESPWSSPVSEFTTASCPILPVIPADKPGWELTFQDEFDGRILDTNKWNKQYRHNAVLHNELQAYVPDAFEVQKGIVRIRADERIGEYGFTTLNYSSGAMVTASKFDQQYGYFEMRARMPVGRGVWPAFWLRPDDLPQGSDEIDIFEFYGENKPKVMHFTYHLPNGSQSHLAYTAPFDFTVGYHRFAVEWGPGYIYWYLDPDDTPTPDEAVHQTTNNITQKKMYVLANLALGGFSGGTFDSTTVFPNYLDIDYIRVYRRDDANFASLSVNIPYIGPTKDARVFAGSTLVTLETSTPGATIYYTLDNSDPITSSTRSPYTDPFTLTNATIVKAYATAPGRTDSPVETAKFTIIPNIISLPSPWQEKDIGNTFTSVPTRFSNGSFVVAGDGATIGNVYDSFKFVYQQLVGDGEIIARVVAIDPTHPQAKEGLMMRQSLERNSPFAGLFMTSRDGMEYLHRLVPGVYGDTTTEAKGRNDYKSFSAPHWFRIVKQGNDYTYYQSSNGSSWTKLSTQTVDMGTGPIYVGLAVTSRFNANEANAAFDSVSLTGQYITPTATPTPTSVFNPADINNDWVVDSVDLSILIGNYGRNEQVGDLNNSGVVNLLDLSIILSNFGL